MTTEQLLLHGWTWNPAVLLPDALALAVYLIAFRHQRRGWYFAAALGVFLLTMLSPLAALADGYLFSAHMLQHILLLLIVPALLLRGLPDSFSLPKLPRVLTGPFIGWLSGVGAMWLWHAPALCDAAVISKPVYALQTLSLIVLGCAFWWPIIAPNIGRRLSPPGAVLYLFSACFACGVLGIILTLSPVTVCSVYTHPADRLGILNTIREGWGISAENDQQIGGLLMWVPMCLIYLAAILGPACPLVADNPRLPTPLLSREKP